MLYCIPELSEAEMALFVEGQSGNLEGRPKNSSKIKAKALALFEEHEYSPLVEMITDAKMIKLRVMALIMLEEHFREDSDKLKLVADNLFKWLELKGFKDKELLQYQFPKLKAIEVSMDKDSPLQFNVNIKGAAENAGVDNVQCDPNS